jgi:transposase
MYGQSGRGHTQRKETEQMASTVFIKAEEIAEELQISKALAYRMIHKWNDELKAKGYTTVQGRVSRQYYREQVYGLSGTDGKR